MTATLPVAAAARKAVPVFSGCLRYFPRAMAEVAALSRIANEQHNPGEPLHWSRDKSADHHDALARHLLEAGAIDADGMRHSAKVAWRALAALELELEAAEEVSAMRGDAQMSRVPVLDELGEVVRWRFEYATPPNCDGNHAVDNALPPNLARAVTAGGFMSERDASGV